MHKIALLSDIHANLPALEAVLRDMPPEFPTSVFIKDSGAMLQTEKVPSRSISESSASLEKFPSHRSQLLAMNMRPLASVCGAENGSLRRQNTLANRLLPGSRADRV